MRLSLEKHDSTHADSARSFRFGILRVAFSDERILSPDDGHLDHVTLSCLLEISPLSLCGLSSPRGGCYKCEHDIQPLDLAAIEFPERLPRAATAICLWSGRCRAGVVDCVVESRSRQSSDDQW